MSGQSIPKNQTKKWLETVVINHVICPFAKREFDADRIHYDVIQTDDRRTQLERLLSHFHVLDEKHGRETTLLIFPNGVSDFEDYLDLLEVANVLLKDQGYEGVYQIASFHPNYRFDGAPENDAANYTNRSPYPMIHILREVSVEQALKTYPDPEKIPERNIRLTRGLGLKTMQDLLEACYK